MLAACKRNRVEQSTIDTAKVFVAARAPRSDDTVARAHAMDSLQDDTTFVCIPDSTFQLGGVQVGDSGDTAMRTLGTALSVSEAVEQGMDHQFDITVYQFKDLEVTVTHSTGRVAAIRPLTPVLRTPLGLYLGMPRSEAERLFPRGALGPVLGGENPPRNALEAYACWGGRASTIELQFDNQSRVARLVLNGFYGAPN